MAFLAWEIYDIYPLIDLNHDGVVVPFANWLDYLSFNLTTQHISFCKKNWNEKITKKKAWSPLPPFFKMLRTNYSKHLKSYTSKWKGGKIEYEPLYIGKIKGTPKLQAPKKFGDRKNLITIWQRSHLLTTCGYQTS
jgi:hypothetical protein